MHRAASKPKEKTRNRRAESKRPVTSEVPPGEFDDSAPPEPEATPYAESVQAAANELEIASLDARGGAPDDQHRKLQAILMVAYQLAGIRDELAILREIEEDRADQEGV